MSEDSTLQALLQPTPTNVAEASSPEGPRGSPASAAPVDGIASVGVPRPPRRRIPMSTPHRRLEVDEIPGYRLYWHKEEKVDAALAAFYEFVYKHEVSLNRTGVGGSEEGGNTDLGSRVSMVSGTDQRGNPQRLVLMKIAIEYFQEDQMSIAQNNAQRLGAIFDDEMILSPEGAISHMGQYEYTPSEGKSARANGRFVPVLNRPKRTAVIGRRGRPV